MFFLPELPCTLATQQSSAWSKIQKKKKKKNSLLVNNSVYKSYKIMIG